MSHLGQFKGLGISAYKREYSWETKDADNKAITQVWQFVLRSRELMLEMRHYICE